MSVEDGSQPGSRWMPSSFYSPPAPLSTTSIAYVPENDLSLSSS